jgi:hypothetical protein
LVVIASEHGLTAREAAGGSDTDDGQHASGLVFEGSVVHGGLILAV